MFFKKSKNLILKNCFDFKKENFENLIDVRKNFNLSKKNIPDRNLHKYSLKYYFKFNEILSLSLINYKETNSRDLEYLYFELISWWHNYLQEEKINTIIFEELEICPFAFSLFIVININKNKFIIKKNNFINKKHKIYKFKYGKIEKLSSINLLFLNIYEMKNYYYSFRVYNLRDKKNKKFKKNLVINFDELNKYLYLDDNFHNLIQFIELNLDLKNNIKIIFFKKQIFKLKYLKFLNIYLIDLIRRQENLGVKVI